MQKLKKKRFENEIVDNKKTTQSSFLEKDLEQWIIT